MQNMGVLKRIWIRDILPMCQNTTMPVYEYGLYHITFYVQQRIPTFSTFSNL